MWMRLTLAFTLANGRHDLLECFKGPFACVALGIPQLGKQRNVTAKTVKRQVTVLSIVAVKVCPFLTSVERIVGSINMILRVAWVSDSPALLDIICDPYGLREKGKLRLVTRDFWVYAGELVQKQQDGANMRTTTRTFD
jgi:hypothetical protein